MNALNFRVATEAFTAMDALGNRVEIPERETIYSVGDASGFMGSMEPEAVAFLYFGNVLYATKAVILAKTRVLDLGSEAP